MLNIKKNNILILIILFFNNNINTKFKCYDLVIAMFSIEIMGIINSIATGQKISILKAKRLENYNWDIIKKKQCPACKVNQKKILSKSISDIFLKEFIMAGLSECMFNGLNKFGIINDNKGNFIGSLIQAGKSLAFFKDFANFNIDKLKNLSSNRYMLAMAMAIGICKFGANHLCDEYITGYIKNNLLGEKVQNEKKYVKYNFGKTLLTQSFKVLFKNHIVNPVFAYILALTCLNQYEKTPQTNIDDTFEGDDILREEQSLNKIYQEYYEVISLVSNGGSFVNKVIL